MMLDRYLCWNKIIMGVLILRTRIVISMMVIALAAALFGGATYAWFTAGEDVDTTFTAGTLRLGDMSGLALNVGNMAPGDVETWNITVENDGSLRMFYRMYFSGNGSLAEQLYVTVNDGSSDIYYGLLSNMLDQQNAIFDSGYPTLNSSATANYTFTFEFSSGAGNAYQGASFTGELKVQAAQYREGINPEDVFWGE